MSFEDFRKYIKWAVSDYNTKRPHSSLNYMTLDEFESAIINEDFRKKWIEKEIGRYKLQIGRQFKIDNTRKIRKERNIMKRKGDEVAESTS